MTILSYNEQTVTVTVHEPQYMCIVTQLRLHRLGSGPILIHAKCPHCEDLHIGKVLTVHPELMAVTVTFHE